MEIGIGVMDHFALLVVEKDGHYGPPMKFDPSAGCRTERHLKRVLTGEVTIDMGKDLRGPTHGCRN